MNKGRIWPSSILILGLGAISALSTLPPHSGKCPFSPRSSVTVPESQQLFRATAELLTDRYAERLDRAAMSQGVVDAVRAELEKNGKSTSMLPFLQMMYLPNQPERFVTSCSAQLPADQLWPAATRGLLRGFHDGRASLVSREETWSFRALEALPMNGIGAVLASEAGNALLIQRTLPGHPAERAGIQAGDTIVAIDGESTLGMGLGTGISRLRGLAGTEVRLTIEHEGSLREVTITREPISPGPAVTTRWRDRQTAGIQLSYLDHGAADQVAAALCQSERARAVVLDLRDLGGHDIMAAQRIASCFVPVNTLVGRMESAGRQRELRTLTPPQFSGEVTVLVNGQTRGAAELIASCLKANGARVVGTTSAGEVGALAAVPMPDGSTLNLPRETWFDAAGQPLDGRGVEADAGR